MRTACAVMMVLMAGSAWAETNCFDEFEMSDKPPPIPLMGRLREVQTDKQYLRDHPAVSQWFYVLDLDRPTCLNTREGTERDIRSVQISSDDPRKHVMLKRYRGKRVSVRFSSVFPEHTAHHRRPIVGEIDTMTPLR